MSPRDVARLLTALCDAGWSIRNDSIYAPNGTMWLGCAQPWHHEFPAFLEQMRGRAKSLRDRPGFTDAVEDTQGLVKVLERLCEDPNFPQAP